MFDRAEPVSRNAETDATIKAFVFDDSIEHEAANESDQLRVVMIFDTWHPDLSPAERTAIAAMAGAAALPLGTL